MLLISTIVCSLAAAFVCVTVHAKKEKIFFFRKYTIRRYIFFLSTKLIFFNENFVMEIKKAKASSLIAIKIIFGFKLKEMGQFLASLN